MLSASITAPPLTYHPHRHPMVNFYTWNGVTARTRAKHEAILNRFLAYRGQSRGVANPSLIPPPYGDEILEWLAVSAEFVQASTVMSWMGSLRAALADFHIDTSCFDSRDFDMFRQGIKRVKGEPAPRTALPITLPILLIINRTILQRGPISPQERLVLASAYALAFACFLRIGEITYTSFDPLKHLQRKDVLSTPQGMAIRLKGSKMDPSRKGIILPLPVITRADQQHVCPSTLLRLMLTNIPGGPDDPLFFFPSGRKGFEAKRLVRECRQALPANGFALADLDGRVFSGHSFRRGAATWGAKVGLDDRTIMLLGRWSLKSLPGGHQRYVDYTLEDRRACLNQMFSPAPLAVPRIIGFDMNDNDDGGDHEFIDDGCPPQ